MEGLIFLLERYAAPPAATTDGVRTITLSDESAYSSSTTTVATTDAKAATATAAAAPTGTAAQYTLAAAALCRVIGDCFAFIEEVATRLEKAGFLLNQATAAASGPPQRRYEVGYCISGSSCPD